MPIRVTVEIIPHGDESNKYTVGVLEIENDGTGDGGNNRGIGNYDLRISGPVDDGDTSYMDFWEQGRLEGFERKRGYWACVKEALNNLKTDFE